MREEAHQLAQRIRAICAECKDRKEAEKKLREAGLWWDEPISVSKMAAFQALRA